MRSARGRRGQPRSDRDGVLRLGYHGWRPPRTSYPPFPECRTGRPRGCQEGQRYLFIDIVCAAGTELFVLNPREGARFCDVPVDAYYAIPVADLDAASTFSGTLCDDGFCPWEPVDRKAMAVWIVRVLDGQDPVPIARSRFDDVDPASFHARFIERMAELGVTGGCGDGSGFCPDRKVSRAQMAVFLARAYDLPDGRGVRRFTGILHEVEIRLASRTASDDADAARADMPASRSCAGWGLSSASPVGAARRGPGGRWRPARAPAGTPRPGAWGRRSWTWAASCCARRPRPAARPPTAGT